MRQRLVAGGAAATLLGGVVALALGTMASPSAGTESPSPAATSRSDDARDEGRGGPPPWAKQKQHDQAWKQAWKNLTAEERRQTMARLVKEHTDGMQTWQRCADAGRSDCEKPLPPGLAKKQLARSDPR